MTESIRNQLLGANEKLLLEIIRTSEAMLQSQSEMARAADQRAMTYAGFLSAAISVIIGGAFVFLFTEIYQPRVGIFLCIVAGTLLFAMFLSTESASPVDFYVPGNKPENWLQDIGKIRKVYLSEQAENYNEMITDNNDVMKKLKKIQRVSFIL